MPPEKHLDGSKMAGKVRERRTNVFLEPPPTIRENDDLMSIESAGIGGYSRRGSVDSLGMVKEVAEGGGGNIAAALEGWDWTQLPEVDRKRISHVQAKEHKKFLSQSQRQLQRQREMIENLRLENAKLRGQYQMKVDEQNALLQDKTNAAVHTLMNQKFGVEEDIEKDLEKLDALKKQMRSTAHQIQAILRETKAVAGERDQERLIRRNEEKVHFYETKHGEVVASGKKLRAMINELRHDKLNVQKRMDEKNALLTSRSTEMVQLINIANDFYAERTHYRVICSEMIADAGREAEEHRAVIQELNNRVEYYDLMMQEREDDYQKALQEAERQASNMNDPQEEVKEAEKKRQQELIEAFDKLMHSFGVWDVGELVEKFLAKEDKFVVQSKYLDALNKDAAVMEDRIKSLKDEADAMEHHKPTEDDEVMKLQTEEKLVLEKADWFHQKSVEATAIIDGAAEQLARMRRTLEASPALVSQRPSRRRWDLIKQNLKRIKLMSERPTSDAVRIGSVLPRTTAPANFDPRRKTLKEEIGDLNDVPQNAFNAILDLGRVEDHVLQLLKAASTSSAAQKKKTMRRPSFNGPGRGSVYLVGPKHDVQKNKGRAEMHFVPSLKDIDSPRDMDPLSPSQIRDSVQGKDGMEPMYSERVAEKIKRLEVGRSMSLMPRNSLSNSSASHDQRNSLPKGTSSTRQRGARRASVVASAEKPRRGSFTTLPEVVPPPAPPHGEEYPAKRKTRRASLIDLS